MQGSLCSLSCLKLSVITHSQGDVNCAQARVYMYVKLGWGEGVGGEGGGGKGWGGEGGVILSEPTAKAR